MWPRLAGRPHPHGAHPLPLRGRQREVVLPGRPRRGVGGRTPPPGERSVPRGGPTASVEAPERRQEREYVQHAHRCHYVQRDVDVTDGETVAAVVPHGGQQREHEHREAFPVNQHACHRRPVPSDCRFLLVFVCSNLVSTKKIF